MAGDDGIWPAAAKAMAGSQDDGQILMFLSRSHLLGVLLCGAKSVFRVVVVGLCFILGLWTASEGQYKIRSFESTKLIASSQDDGLRHGQRQERVRLWLDLIRLN